VPQWVFWSALAKAQIRAIDKTDAMRIFEAILRLREGLGDIKSLAGYNPPCMRLKVNDYRVLYRKRGDKQFDILAVGHRRDIYR
jgi:mRNA-degrading endonuclease RelE of RelBE toxin-antitoxin system